ncbi:MAG: imidazole glycerol phosphate synthase subunit HisH [Acidobacteriaceae bacterium]
MPSGKTLVIDYQAGNLNSVCKALRMVGADVQVTNQADELREAARIVLPGVGHFSSTGCLIENGIGDALRECVAAGTPFLGICVGLQWLCAGSTEAPETHGLGIFPFMCDRFLSTVKSPHVGWNSLEPVGNSRLLHGLPASPFVYYTHSYRVPRIHGTTAVTNYGEKFSAVIERDNWMAVQFHPEKSGAVGLRILENFMGILPC